MREAGASQFGRRSPFFPRAGEQRAPSFSALRRQRRQQSDVTAAALAEGGVRDEKIYTTTQIDTLLDLASEGQLRETLGRQRRQWTGFADHAHMAKAKRAREYSTFCAEQRITTVIQAVVRSPQSILPIERVRAEHARQSAQLGDRIRYGRRRVAPGFECDIISAEVVSTGQGGDVVHLHFHLVVRAEIHELRAMCAYFQQSGWSWWDAVTAQSPDRHRPPGALASYVSKGLAHALQPAADGSNLFSPKNTATLFGETSHLAMTRSTGAFRIWKAKLKHDGQIVAEDHLGRLCLRPARQSVDVPRFRKRLLTGSCPQLLRLCVHDFGDGIMRPAMLVRGDIQVDFAGITVTYDISTAITSARRAFPDLLGNTTTPESTEGQRRHWPMHETRDRQNDKGGVTVDSGYGRAPGHGASAGGQNPFANFELPRLHGDGRL